jgi:hypothetical protein
MIRILIAVLLAFFSSAAAADDPTLAKGRAAAAAFFAGDTVAIWRQMTPEMQGAVGSEAALADLRAQLLREYGAEASPPREDVQDQGTFQTYRRIAPWTKSTKVLAFQFSFDPIGRIAGFHIRLAPVAAESRFLDYQTKAKLRLPFDGDWVVVWGGHEIETNYHAADRAQRFALDLLVLKDGATLAGDAAKLEHYYCWGRPILAPADGTVVTAIDGLRDEKIGEGNPKAPAGNHVVLDLGNSEYAFLAHLRKGSVTVKPGDAVRAGRELGRCGNSGNSTEPHLHFHLQTTPDLQDGEGLPVFFESYVADGKLVARGEPVQGQVISPAP